MVELLGMNDGIKLKIMTVKRCDYNATPSIVDLKVSAAVVIPDTIMRANLKRQ
nr:hypothetical protein K62PH164C2_LOCUS42 [Klebsiella phage vB_Kpn_K62PH164C2]